MHGLKNLGAGKQDNQIKLYEQHGYTMILMTA